MQIDVTDPVFETQVFVALFFLALCFSLRKSVKKTFFDLHVTNELKGFAILAVIFGHLGYIVSRNHEFMWPLSADAGVGVNIFLFLSGFGLCMATRKGEKIGAFYTKRLKKLFIPMWLTLLIFFGLDFFVKHLSFSPRYILESFLGIFRTADPWNDINSPLWYFTIILFYYLIFPLKSWIKNHYLLSLAIFVIGLVTAYSNLPIKDDLHKIYKMHVLAFPLGILFFALLQEKLVVQFISKLSEAKLLIYRYDIARLVCLLFLIFLVTHFSVYSAVGEGIWPEQTMSMFIVILVTAVFMLKNFQIKLLEVIGKYSYEIYLLHWPIVFRYDYIFHYLPAGIATFIFLTVLLILAFVLQKVTNLNLRNSSKDKRSI